MKNKITLLLILISFYGFSQSAAFLYSLDTYCANDSNPIAIPINSGGVFSINNGGVINTNNGEINLSLSGLGTDGTGNFIIMYTTVTDSATFSISIVDVDDTSFSYNSTYAINGVNPIPINIATSGGAFFITGGAIIDLNTGEIDLSSTNVGQNYKITYTTAGFCTSTSSFIINIVESLNTSTNILQNNISIYPNPAKKYFKLKNESSIHLMEIEIINYLGKTVKKVDLKNMPLEKQISVTNLNTGIYFIKISSEKYFITKKLMVK